MKCQVCGVRCQLVGTRSEQPHFGVAELHACPKCASVFSDHISNAAPEAVEAYYRSLSVEKDDPGAPERARIVLAKLLRLSPRPRSLFDFGCGSMELLRLAAREDLRCEGWDPYTHDEASFAPGPWDAVTCIEVLEHLPAASGLEAFERVLGLAKVGGYALISAQLREPWEDATAPPQRNAAPGHCTWWTVDALCRVAADLRCRLVSDEREPMVGAHLRLLTFAVL